MSKETKSLGQLELEVLKVVWDRKSCTVGEVSAMLSTEKGYARTTILTVIQRLHKKGFVKRKKQDGVFHYYPTEKKSAVLGNLARQFIENIFEGSPANLVQHIASEEVSAEELRQIRKIIDEALEEEGEEK